MGVKKIYIAGGCLWGVEEYFSYLNGVLSTKVGFANGFIPKPTYKNMVENKNGYAEACEIIYDDDILSFQTILAHMFKIIDPTSLNKQGNDIGTKYRTGIYWVDEADKEIALEFVADQQKNYTKPIVVEVEPLSTFFLASEENQQYLKKNVGGYCHIPQKLIDDLK